MPSQERFKARPSGRASFACPVSEISRFVWTAAEAANLLLVGFAGTMEIESKPGAKRKRGFGKSDLNFCIGRGRPMRQA